MTPEQQNQLLQELEKGLTQQQVGLEQLKKQWDQRPKDQGLDLPHVEGFAAAVGQMREQSEAQRDIIFSLLDEKLNEEQRKRLDALNQRWEIQRTQLGNLDIQIENEILENGLNQQQVGLERLKKQWNQGLDLPQLEVLLADVKKMREQSEAQMNTFDSVSLWAIGCEKDFEKALAEEKKEDEKKDKERWLKRHDALHDRWWEQRMQLDNWYVQIENAILEKSQSKSGSDPEKELALLSKYAQLRNALIQEMDSVLKQVNENKPDMIQKYMQAQSLMLYGHSARVRNLTEMLKDRQVGDQSDGIRFILIKLDRDTSQREWARSAAAEKFNPQKCYKFYNNNNAPLELDQNYVQEKYLDYKIRNMHNRIFRIIKGDDQSRPLVQTHGGHSALIMQLNQLDSLLDELDQRMEEKRKLLENKPDELYKELKDQSDRLAQLRAIVDDKECRGEALFSFSNQQLSHVLKIQLMSFRERIIEMQYAKRDALRDMENKIEEASLKKSSQDNTRKGPIQIIQNKDHIYNQSNIQLNNQSDEKGDPYKEDRQELQKDMLNAPTEKERMKAKAALEELPPEDDKKRFKLIKRKSWIMIL